MIRQITKQGKIHIMNDSYQFNEKWERDDWRFLEEIKMITHNIIPYSGKRMITRNAVNWQSQNPLYWYSRIINSNVSWLIEVRCTEDYQREPYYTFEVMMPNEFLDQDLFMKLNTGEI